MRTGAALALLAALLCAAACSRGDFFRQHEYEEEIFLSLDGSAEVYVNASIAALNALRGSSFDTAEGAQIDRDAIRQFFTTPVTTVTQTPALTRRAGRRFIHVRMEVEHIGKLAQAAPFAWSTYQLSKDGALVIFNQHVGASAGKDVGDVGWNGDESVSFRAHMPSSIVYHNAGADGLRRGNILVWEQPLAARLKGEPMDLEARMESQSILSRTLLLFGATAIVVAMMFAGIILWVVKKK
jgi:hypothetical protein